MDPCAETSALHCAIEVDQPDIVRMLLETGTLPIDEPNHVARTPPYLAALEGDLDASNLFIDHEADMDTRDRWKDEVLLLAQFDRHLEVMICQGADAVER